ncbi:MAG: hypothetical protein LBR00_02810, partial [Clostridiales Family XIII bacterium]|nr:hypothetical protein [Clostridiales Family XIII bacterium]
MENEKMRIADRFGVKLLVFLLCTACFAYGAYMAVQATHALDWNNNPLLPTTDPRFVLAKGGYATSDLFVQAVDGDVNELYTMATTSKSDAYIDSGAATAEDLDAMLRGVYDGLAASCAGAVPGQLSGGYQIDVGGEPQTFGYEAFLASDAFIVREEWDAGGGTVSSSRGWEEAGVREAFRALYSEQVKAVEEGLKALRKQELRNFQARLDEQGLLYFATDGANTLTNVPALAKSTALDAATQDALDALGAPVSYRFSKAGGELTASAEGTLSEIGGVADRLFPYGQDAVSQVLSDPYWAPSTPFPVPEGTALFVAYTDAYFAAHDAALERVRDAYRTIALPAAAAWVACLVLCVMLLVWTGRKRAARAAECRPYKDEASIVDVEAASCRPYKDEASIVDVGAACSRPPTGQPSYRWDRCPMELQIILIALCVGVAAVTMRAYAIARIESNAVYSSVYWPAGTFGDVLFCGAMAALFALGLWCLTSLVRNGAAGTFAARSGVCLGAAALGRGVALLAHTAKTGFDGTNPLAKTVVLVAAFWLVTSIFAGGLGLALRGGRGEIPVVVFAILLVVVLALALWFTVRWARRY